MIGLLDIITSLLLIVSMYLCVKKPQIGWFLYTVDCVLYFALMLVNQLYAMSIVAIFLFFIGISNYRKVRKQ